jgi:hypothetical protein
VIKHVAQLTFPQLLAHAVLDIQVEVSDLEPTRRIGTKNVDHTHTVDVETPSDHKTQQLRQTLSRDGTFHVQTLAARRNGLPRRGVGR